MSEPTTCPCPFPGCDQTMRMRYPGNDPENGPAEMHCPVHGAHSTFDSAGYLPVPEQNDEPHPSERLPHIGDRVDNLKNFFGTVLEVHPPSPTAQGAGTDVHVQWDDGSTSWIDAGNAEFIPPNAYYESMKATDDTRHDDAYDQHMEEVGAYPDPPAEYDEE